MSLPSWLRRLDERVLPPTGRPSQKTVQRRSWALVALMAVLMIGTFFDHGLGIPFGVVAFWAGVWAGRLQEAALAAKGRGIAMDEPVLPLGIVTWPDKQSRR